MEYKERTHAHSCDYPKKYCNCHVDNEDKRRKIHDTYCFYPSEPCCCKLEEAKKGGCE